MLTYLTYAHVCSRMLAVRAKGHAAGRAAGRHLPGFTRTKVQIRTPYLLGEPQVGGVSVRVIGIAAGAAGMREKRRTNACKKT